MSEMKMCASYVDLKILVESQGNICRPIAPKGTTIDSVAVTRTKYQVSITKKLAEKVF